MSTTTSRKVPNDSSADDNKFTFLNNTSKASQHREPRITLPAFLSAQMAFSDLDGKITRARLVNVSRFGARIETDSSDSFLTIGMTIPNVVLTIQQSIIFNGDITVVAEHGTNEGKVSYGVVLSGDGLEPEQVEAIVGIAENPQNITSTKETLHLLAEIRPEFKILVADLNTVFQDLKQKLQEEESRIKGLSQSESHTKRLEEHAINLATSLYTDDIRAVFRKFKEITEKFLPEEVLLHKRYFRANFHPAVLGSPFVSRAYTKPLGYAGDFGLMVFLYEYSDIGSSLFDKFLHRFSCNEPAAVANKNRVELLSDMLLDTFASSKTQSFRISTIACGPAKEIELFLDSISSDEQRKIEAICVDHDSTALDYAQKRIRTITNKRKNVRSFFFKEDAVLGVIREKDFVSHMVDSDVIISAGLFDYISDRVAAKLVSSLFKYIKVGGSLLIGNVSDKNPDRFSMDYFMEWNLVLRSEADLLKLVDESIIANKKGHAEVISESLGLNLFLKLTKLSD